MIFVESSRDACLSFDECYEICFRQNCTFSFALFVHFHLTFTCKFIEPYVDSDDYNKLRSKIYKKTRYYAGDQNKYFDKMKEIVSRILDVIMYLIPFFGKRKRDRVVREVRYHTTCKEVCKVKTTEREKEHEKD